MRWYFLLLLLLTPGRTDITEAEGRMLLALDQDERLALVEYAMNRGWSVPYKIYYFGDNAPNTIRVPREDGDLVSLHDHCWLLEVSIIQCRANGNPRWDDRFAAMFRRK